MIWKSSLPVALLAIAVAVFAAHNRLIVQSRPRTILGGNTFEDTRDGTGQRFKYRLTENEAGESVGLYEALIRAGVPGAMPGRSASPPLHSHKTQTECFTVREGRAGFLLNEQEASVDALDSAASQPVCVPPGVPHSFWNARNETDLRVDVTLQPPGNSLAFFRTLIGFGKDQGGLGNLSPLQLFATFVEGGVQLEDMPKPAWWALEHVLVPWFIVPVLGVDPFPAEYTAH
jgi:mannose-6-phosphate isomerase-like protein (cupin superfamily)